MLSPMLPILTPEQSAAWCLAEAGLAPEDAVKWAETELKKIYEG